MKADERPVRYASGKVRRSAFSDFPDAVEVRDYEHTVPLWAEPGKWPHAMGKLWIHCWHCPWHHDWLDVQRVCWPGDPLRAGAAGLDPDPVALPCLPQVRLTSAAYDDGRVRKFTACSVLRR